MYGHTIKGLFHHVGNFQIKNLNKFIAKAWYELEVAHANL